MTALEQSLARLSGDEIVSALGLASARPAIRTVVRAFFSAASTPLGRVLARFDARVASMGLARAAALALADLGASCRREGAAPPATGPLLVVANHPGAYDTMGLLCALARDDVTIVAADRAFLRALPNFSRHLLFFPEGPSGSALGRARALRVAFDRLARGGALLHFGAGRIEPDPAFFYGPDADLLASWPSGTGALVRGAARASGAVVAAAAVGVHSRRAKRSLLTRVAESRGVTTLAPLLQLTVPLYRRVDATVRFARSAGARELAATGADEAITADVRARVRALLRPG